MRNIPPYLMLWLVTLACHAGSPDFRPLFNGNDLSGWWGLGTEDPSIWMELPAEALAKKKADSLADVQAHWRVEDGVLVNDGSGPYLTTGEFFGDFELLLEYKTEPRADSGIYLRGIPQVQIWDSTEEAKFKLGADKGSGGLWNNSETSPGRLPLVCADKPFGEWNQMRIRMVGEYVTVDLNGQRVVDHERLHNYFSRKKARPLPIPRRGPVQLQTHGGEIRWRNLSIRDIHGDEANQILMEKAGDRGETPSDWIGAVDNYEIHEDRIACRRGKGGTLFTRRQYGDFRLQFLVQIPPEGNNGLAIRYPGVGDPAYSGMCELQILDNAAKKFENLDARQVHGSAYGMVSAHQGYLRPAGEWNFQTVEVRGSELTVELNGTRILDADLSGVTEFLRDKAHPGKDRTNGHFGFAGHGSAVVFRNIKIEELDHEQ